MMEKNRYLIYNNLKDDVEIEQYSVDSKYNLIETNIDMNNIIYDYEKNDY